MLDATPFSTGIIGTEGVRIIAGQTGDLLGFAGWTMTVFSNITRGLSNPTTELNCSYDELLAGVLFARDGSIAVMIVDGVVGPHFVRPSPLLLKRMTFVYDFQVVMVNLASVPAGCRSGQLCSSCATWTKPFPYKVNHTPSIDAITQTLWVPVTPSAVIVLDLGTQWGASVRHDVCLPHPFPVYCFQQLAT
jgi:hypothetical protein